jgi:hypothetical protein
MSCFKIPHPAAFAVLAVLAALMAWGAPSRADTITFTQPGGPGTDYILNTYPSPPSSIPTTSPPISVPGSPLGGVLTFNLTLNGDYSGIGVYGYFNLDVDTSTQPGWSNAALTALGGGPGSTTVSPTDYSGGATLTSTILDSTTWTTTINPSDNPETLNISSDFFGTFLSAPTFSYNFAPNNAGIPGPTAGSGLPGVLLLGGLLAWWRLRQKRRPICLETRA